MPIQATPRPSPAATRMFSAAALLSCTQNCRVALLFARSGLPQTTMAAGAL